MVLARAVWQSVPDGGFSVDDLGARERREVVILNGGSGPGAERENPGRVLGVVATRVAAT